MLEIYYCAPHDPQTSGKIEPFTRRLKAITRPSADSGRCVPRAARTNLTQEGRTKTTHDRAAAALESGPLEPETKGETEP
jgi:hypothetical protein